MHFYALRPPKLTALSIDRPTDAMIEQKKCVNYHRSEGSAVGVCSLILRLKMFYIPIDRTILWTVYGRLLIWRKSFGEPGSKTPKHFALFTLKTSKEFSFTTNPVLSLIFQHRFVSFRAFKLVNAQIDGCWRRLSTTGIMFLTFSRPTIGALARSHQRESSLSIAAVGSDRNRRFESSSSPSRGSPKSETISLGSSLEFCET